MDLTQRFSEMAHPLAVVHADSETIEVNSAYVFAGNYHRFAVVIDVGDMGSSATFDVQLEQATDDADGGLKDIAGKALTQLTQASGDGNDIFCIELKGEEMDQDNGFDYFRVEFTPGTAAVEFSAVIYGLVPRYAPVPSTAWEEVVD